MEQEDKARWDSGREDSDQPQKQERIEVTPLASSVNTPKHFPRRN
jgi:hypothetical protein